ncbi:MAG TPA: ATP-binding protein [Gemmatimonadaceae bacterium]|nr:ATP-binding protein [Gemmatimonadaceae bacterium]
MSPLRELPLARKLPLLILSLLAVVLTISLALSYYEVRRSAELAAAERVSGLSQVLGSMVDAQIATRLALMSRAAHDPALDRALATPERDPDPTVHAALAKLSTAADSATPPELWTADGRLVGSVRLESEGETDRLRQEFRDFPTRGDSERVSSFFRENGHTEFWMAVPIRRGGRTVGYIAQERRLNSNPNSLRQLRTLLGSGIDLYFRNAHDTTWVDPIGRPAPTPIDSSAYSRGVARLTLRKTGPALAVTRPIARTPLLVTIEYPAAGYLARPHAILRVLVVIAVLLAVLATLIAWAAGRRLVRPLVELTGAAEAIAHGRYTERVRTASADDELGRLASSFNRMASEVEDASAASARALSELTKTAARQRFLAEAGRILAGSISDDRLLVELARFCVPTLGDYCSIHLAGADGVIHRVETAHYDPEVEPRVRALVARYPYRVDGGGPVAQALRSQSPILIARLDAARLRRESPDGDTAHLLEEVKPSSFLCVPMVARGHAVGAISLTMTDSGRVFGEHELSLATELAQRTAVAIDNAVLYRNTLMLQQEAEAASNAKSDFLAKMSHEIRTPINAMMGYAELLQMGIAGPVAETQARYLSRIRASGDHLTSLINEILDLSKIEAGRMVVAPTLGIARDAIEAAATLIRPQASAKNIDLAIEVDGSDKIEYYGDPQRIQQILTNLLSNAVKFTAPGGRVTMSCTTGAKPGHGGLDARWACISVHDTGVGISPDDLDRVFQPFVQVESGYTRSHGGTGLGLTISRDLAHMMGGDITVESAVGEGSTFSLWLPTTKPAAVAQFVQW